MTSLEQVFERALVSAKEMSKIYLAERNRNIHMQEEISRLTTQQAELQQRIQSLTAERDAIERHNPEVIGAQEDHHDILMDAVEIPHHLASSNVGFPEPELRDHVTRELSYHIALLPGPPCVGEARLSSFRNWLHTRETPAAPTQVTDGSTVVGEVKRGFKFKRTDTRLCHEPVMFVQQHVAWVKYPQQHGLVICPRFEYGPTTTFLSASSWSRSTRWRAYAEEKCEVFYTRAGKIHYAGTYLCHSGPCALQLDDLGTLKTDILVSALAKATRTSNHRTTEQEELQTIEGLYDDGVLPVDIFGIERIGFNTSLYDNMRMRYGHSLANRKARTPIIPPLPPSPIIPLSLPVDSPPLALLAPPNVPEPLVYRPPGPPASSTRVYVPPAPIVSRLPEWRPVTPFLTHSYAPLASSSTTASSSSSAPLSSLSANTYSQNKRRADNVASSSSSARPAKFPRLSSYDYDSDDGYRPEDDEGYLFYCGSNYYRRAHEEEEEADAIYKSLNIPDIIGDMIKEEEDADGWDSPAEASAVGRTSAYEYADEEEEEEEEYSDEE
ncbi:hypothetical protein GY45DRAFT_1319911 [Cubamyces sp. BRFM 1775]|nr:hypothetical protein GY45DRAFT_1319911 [Cubamyces sp. BRFM 1775]